jgi:hypothetical protein
MVIQHWMISSCLTHGRFLTRLQRENWATGGLSLVIEFSLPRLDTDLLAGYDKTIQGSIIALLDSDEDFRSKCQDLLHGETIDISIEDLDHSSFVPFPSSPKHG